MIPKFEELKEVHASTDGWTILDAKSDSIKIEIKKSVRGLNMMKASSELPFSPKEILRFM